MISNTLKPLHTSHLMSYLPHLSSCYEFVLHPPLIDHMSNVKTLLYLQLYDWWWNYFEAMDSHFVKKSFPSLNSLSLLYVCIDNESNEINDIINGSSKSLDGSWFDISYHRRPLTFKIFCHIVIFSYYYIDYPIIM